MHLGDERQHRRGIDRRPHIVPAGEQIDCEWPGGERANLSGGVENLLRRRIAAARHRRQDNRMLDAQLAQEFSRHAALPRSKRSGSPPDGNTVLAMAALTPRDDAKRRSSAR
jgi:hypothetical protein